MHPRPTYDDANLILRLYEMRREARMRQARAWFTSKCKGVQSFDELMKLAPPGSDENASYRQVVTYWDTVASFIASGILHKELFFQSGRELLLVWERMRDILPGLREKNTDAFAYTNLETVAQAYISYLDRRSPGTYAAFSSRQRG